MSLFYGVRLTFDDFLIHLLENDPDFQTATLAWLQDPNADPEWRENFGQYELKDVLGDILGEPTGKAKDLQCADFFDDVEIERVRTLYSESQLKRMARCKESTSKLLPLTLFEGFEIEHDGRPDYTKKQEEGLVYIGQRLEVYSDLQRKEVPVDLTELHERLLVEFPSRKPGFISGY